MKFYFGKNYKVYKCSIKNCDEANHTHLDNIVIGAAKYWSEKTYSSAALSPERIERFLYNNPDPEHWVIKPKNDPYQLAPIYLSKEVEYVKNAILPILEDYYEGGKGLSSVALKNYTSGDHGANGFESVVEKCINSAAAALGVSNYSIDQEYFRPTIKEGDLDPMRLDQHVWVNGRLVALIENRAWIDKPFYELKRNVIQTFESLPHTKKHIGENTRYLFLGLNIDITNRLINTQNIVYMPKCPISVIPLSEGKRNGKSNYFENGLSLTGVSHFADFLYKILDPN